MTFNPEVLLTISGFAVLGYAGFELLRPSKGPALVALKLQTVTVYLLVAIALLTAACDKAPKPDRGISDFLKEKYK